MFWRMGLSTASPVETILDKENFTLEELLDEDEIIQECKSLNGRLINFLRERAQVEQLIRYIVEEAPEEAERLRSLKFPFIACEVFTCEVDIILKALVEDEELMNLLFSFLDPERPHSTQLAGYFSKVVVCLLLRKTSPLMNYIQAHQDIIKKLVDLIRITSIVEVLIRLIGSDEHIYANSMDSMQWLEDMNVLEMIVDKFSSSDCPEVHANAAETLCAITRYAPPGLASKISSPSFIGSLFRHALEDSRPKSVLVNLLSICISLLDPKRLTPGTYYMYNRQLAHGSGITAKPETVEAMLESLGDLLKLLDLSFEDHVLLTTYGKLQPPLGKHRLKIIEFISVLVAASSEVAEKEMIRLGAVKRILELFFEYPYNNFLHHHVEHIIVSCLESKNSEFVKHLLRDCKLTGKILEAEKNSTLAVDVNMPTVPVEGRSSPRIGNIGHITRIANKLIQLGNDNNDIQTIVQENGEWVEWQTNMLLKRNVVENVFQWACGRPTSLQDRTRDSDDDDYQDRDYDVAALANNLSQAFQYGIYSSDDIEEAHGSLERDDEDVYFDDESAEVVISSLRLGDDQESGSLFTNSNWFAYEDERTVNEQSTDLVASASPNIETGEIVNGGNADDTIINEGKDLADIASSGPPEPKPILDDPLPGGSSDLKEIETGSSSDLKEIETGGHENSPISVEGMKISDSVELFPTLNSADTSNPAQPPSLPNRELQVESDAADTSNAAQPPSLPNRELQVESDAADTSNAAQPPSLPNRELQVESDARPDDVGPDAGDASSSSVDGPADSLESPDLTERESGTTHSQYAEGEGTSNIVKTDSLAGTDGSSEHEEAKN